MRARQWGDQLGLYTTGDYHFNWGGLDEKWLKGSRRFVVLHHPQRRPLSLARSLERAGGHRSSDQRSILGDKSLDGTFVATFGRPPSARNSNDFHDDPRKLTARLLKSVTTGPEVLAELVGSWRLDVAARNPVFRGGASQRIARRRALDRLKGTSVWPGAVRGFPLDARGSAPRLAGRQAARIARRLAAAGGRRSCRAW